MVNQNVVFVSVDLQVTSSAGSSLVLIFYVNVKCVASS
jgi:hypothetical protein